MTSRNAGPGFLGADLVNPYRQVPSTSRGRGRRRALSGAGIAVTAVAAVVGGAGATAAHAGPNGEIGAAVVRAATDASLNDGAVGGVVVRELASRYGCVPETGLAAVGAHARQLVAAAGGRPGLVRLAKDLADHVGATPYCITDGYLLLGQHLGLGLPSPMTGRYEALLEDPVAPVDMRDALSAGPR